MIFGVLLLFTFVGLFLLVKDTATGTLSEEQEKLYTEILQKEGLRLFVENCLEDPLKEGLEIIGKQGRLWNDQPGGAIEFSKERGILIEGVRVAYSIREEKRAAENVYPCNTADNPPGYCQYTYPNITVGFGERDLLTVAVEGDLNRYLHEKTKECVKKFVNEKISTDAVILDSEFELFTDLRDDAILIEAEYPLRFKVQGKEFFTKSRFDMVYKTSFKKFLSSVVAAAIRWDTTYVEFPFTTEGLAKDKFVYQRVQEGKDCTGNGPYECAKKLVPLDSFEIKMEESSVGDVTLRTFTGKDFVYTVARQNRRPALDYISRKQCSEKYDYLVVKEHGTLGKIDFVVNAYDADEDVPVITVDDKGLGGSFNGKQYFYQPKTEEGIKEILVTATDKHGKKDWQNVRVAIDQPLTTLVEVSQPYGFSWISKEDPVFVKMIVPKTESLIHEKVTSLATYTIGDKVKTFEKIGENLCFPDCGTEDIETISVEPFTESGKLKLTSTVNYCGDHSEPNEMEVNVVVKECVPYQNENRPFAYPYHEYEFEGGKYKGKSSVDPFLATHSCCSTNGEIKKEGECFTDPEPNCYGEKATKGFVLEEKFAECNGERGNVCGKEQYRLVKENGAYKCGNDQSLCGSIPTECKDGKAYGLIKNKGWCYGTAGCQLYCDKSKGEILVYTGKGQPTKDIAAEAAKNNLKVDYACSKGCQGQKGRKCDSNFDGTFEGTCEDVGGKMKCVG